ncbi:uncharacterized protein HMPREF1541_03358 [Cyphellophora europaea CBS 101466]|uniref:L-2,4-diaminobutyrate decarboxylase n=1 Tax=Cyphellophora europaea (strain CBS 101466) TaxID=1220924 RepID=W2S079_CYPE1|nr:uncharacterized protein HMPREF1541_03358 [Cyphellophora europaea CBS 101466]ETN41423.1 hypothetical protein HMPREF1541_03358 [Cyphellophora europaea CBS 101466]
MDSADGRATSGMESKQSAASEALEDVCRSFLRARSQVSSQRIVDVANATQIADIRSRATPTREGLLISDTIQEVLDIFSHRVAMDDPRFFGFIPSPVHPSAFLGDILTTMFNTHAGSWYQSSGPSAVEDTLLTWLADQAGLPSTSGGVFVSGGSMANLSAIIAARDTKLKFEDRARARIYLSEQTHSSVQKGLSIAGFHSTQTKVVPCDDLYRMKVGSLREAILEDRAAGMLPFLIVATCGLTNTGGIDPLPQLADVADEEDLWLHVDGAYGASVVLSKKHKHRATGIGRAHSLSWDAHKWLFQTYACGVLLVRDKLSLVKTFSTNASYIQDAEEMESSHINFWNRGMELTRPARAMKLWFSLRMLGTDKVEEMINHGIALAETAEESIRSRPDWKLVTAAQLGIVNFKFSPAGLNERNADDAAEIEKLNAEISRRAIARNIAAPLTTRLKGDLNLRMCAIHPNLTHNHMVQLLGHLSNIAQEVIEGA